MMAEESGVSIQDTMRALSDPVRRQILESLKGDRKSAGEIAEMFDISAPAISRHLSVLKEAGLVRDYRQGKYIFYELKASVLEETLLWITNLKGA
jgi:DNA-binding transcriptional ArsR family regulator